ncbi:excalibur calcium-binding domain-containing protein [Kocuria sp. NPDC057446]|uniref:excalibur calcium-binding domain-containing protein n=1 Tax=Kocuria sp. NPDC057446 TaxID=3346137 RepID=UPI0036B8FF65
MKKSAAGAALVAAVGLSALTAAPASALSFPLFDNCDAAAAAGVYNIPAGDPRYTPALDSDADGIACENPDYAYVPLPPVGDVPVTPETPQVEQMPVGGADTGVSVAPEQSGTGIAALGLAGIAAATGGVVLVRRRGAGA